MTKCLICGKEFGGRECPICSFPVIDFLGDLEEGLKELAPTLQKHKANFTANLKVGIVIYHYKIDENEVVTKESEDVLFGTAAELMETICWREESFDNPSDRKEVSVSLFIECRDKRNEIVITIPNFPDSEKLEIGASIDDLFYLSFYTRSAQGSVECLKKFYLFD